MPGRVVEPVQRNPAQRLVDLLVQPQRHSRLGDGLGQILGRVADRLVGIHAVEQGGLRAGRRELRDRLVIPAQRVLRRARPLDGKQAVDGLLVTRQPSLHPAFQAGGRNRARAVGIPGVRNRILSGEGLTDGWIATSVIRATSYPHRRVTQEPLAGRNEAG